MNARFRAYRLRPLEPGWFLIMKGLPVRRHHSPHKGGGLRVWMGPYEGYYPRSCDSLSLLGLAELGHPVVPRGEALCTRQWRCRQFGFFFSRSRIKTLLREGWRFTDITPTCLADVSVPFARICYPEKVLSGLDIQSNFFLEWEA
jgi:hypothetical protein